MRALYVLLALPAALPAANLAALPVALPAQPTAQPTALNCSYWYEAQAHGASFRNARQFGARGDGVADDTAAIQAAFDYQQGGGDGSGLAASPAIVYLPPGTYLISDTLVLWFYSHLVGNALCPPTLLLAPSTPGFSGAAGLKPMVTANLGYNISVRHHAWWMQGKYLGGHANDLFYVQVHHVNLRVLPGNAGAVGILWPVAQQTSLRRIAIDMTGSGAIGIDFAGGAGYNATYPYNASLGGGGTVEDIAIHGSAIGLNLAGSQWSYRNITVTGAASACIAATGMAWAHTIIAANLSHCPTALLARLEGAGSVHVLDSTLGPGLGSAAINVTGTQGGLYLQALTVLGAPEYVVDGLLPLQAPGGGARLASWGLGPSYLSGAPQRLPQGYGHLPLPRAASAVAAGAALACAGAAGAPALCGGSAEDPATGLASAPPRPVFQGLPFLSAVTHFGAVGDGVADDTLALQRGLASASALFLPSGTYRVSDTLQLQCNGTLVGEGLATLALSASAPGYGTAAALKAVLATAPSTPSAPCYAHVADIALSTLGAGNGGALLLNHTGSALSGFWDVTMRLNGFAVGLKAQLGPGVPQDSAFARDSGGGVLSNAWCVQITTQGPLLLLGTNFEHAGLMEYNFTGASNIVGSVIQTEGETLSVLLEGTGATGPLAFFGTVFGSSTGHGDNKTLLAGRGRGACVEARLQTLLAVDQGPSGGYQIPGNASQRWELLDVLKGC